MSAQFIVITEVRSTSDIRAILLFFSCQNRNLYKMAQEVNKTRFIWTISPVLGDEDYEISAKNYHSKFFSYSNSFKCVYKIDSSIFSACPLQSTVVQRGRPKQILTRASQRGAIEAVSV